MTILARAIQDRFPKYYHYFATRTLRVPRQGRCATTIICSAAFAGVDGMKTGYIHDSGFNIVASVRRGPRHILAVVFGGRTAEARDARVVSLIDNNINVASIKRTAPPIVEGSADRGGARQGRQGSQGRKDKAAAASPAPQRAEPAPGSTDPIKPIR